MRLVVKSYLFRKFQPRLGGRTPQHLYHQRSSPSKDSALGSRESTPNGGSLSMSSQPRPAPEGQRNSDGCIDDSQLRVVRNFRGLDCKN